jgi:hypothetical protein
MRKSKSITKLSAALAKAQSEMPVAPFDATNPFLKSKYATLGVVIQTSRPILAKHGLSLVQFPISGGPNLGLPDATRQGVGDCIGVESILMHESGEFIAERILIPLTEEKGKSRVQAGGSTLTYLRRYSWASILGMYSDEDSDGTTAMGNCSPIKPTLKAAATLPPPPMRTGGSDTGSHTNN